MYLLFSGHIDASARARPSRARHPHLPGRWGSSPRPCVLGGDAAFIIIVSPSVLNHINMNQVGHFFFFFFIIVCYNETRSRSGLFSVSMQIRSPDVSVCVDHRETAVRPCLQWAVRGGIMRRFHLTNKVHDRTLAQHNASGIT